MTARCFKKIMDVSKLNGNTAIYDVVKKGSVLGEVMIELCVDTLKAAARMIPDDIEFYLMDGDLSFRTARRVTKKLGSILRKARIKPMHSNWCFY